MHSVLDTLSDSTGSTMANDLDLIFLKGIMESPVVSKVVFLYHAKLPEVQVLLFSCHLPSSGSRTMAFDSRVKISGLRFKL